uniref:Ferredoxin--NADP(+) reductase n=1 Tax=Steinernema glaseri TaxID=37863 RepID=A0A1I8AJ89_9BILA
MPAQGQLIELVINGHGQGEYAVMAFCKNATFSVLPGDIVKTVECRDVTDQPRGKALLRGYHYRLYKRAALLHVRSP